MALLVCWSLLLRQSSFLETLFVFDINGFASLLLLLDLGCSPLEQKVTWGVRLWVLCVKTVPVVPTVQFIDTMYSWLASLAYWGTERTDDAKNAGYVELPESCPVLPPDLR